MVRARTATPAQTYQEYFGPAIFEPLADILFQHAPPQPGERVLDLACGTGIVTRRAARLAGAAGSVVGVDINPGMLAAAREQPAPEGAAIRYEEGNAIALELPDGAFDVVLCQQGLQFFPDRAEGARQMRRVLAGGGRAVIAVWQGLDRHPLYRALADAEVPHLTDFGVPVTYDDVVRPFSFGDEGELRGLLTGAGFRDIEVVEDSIDATFAEADRFVELTELAYAAVVPQFVENPAAFDAYLERVAEATRDIIDEYRQGDQVVVPMHTRVAVART